MMTDDPFDGSKMSLWLLRNYVLNLRNYNYLSCLRSL